MTLQNKKVRLADIILSLEIGARPKGGSKKKAGILSVGGEHLDGEGGFCFQKP